MKILITLILLSMSLSGYTKQPTVKDLSWREPTQLELVVNNLNNMLIFKHDEIMEQTAESEKDDDIKTKKVRFYISKDKNLVASYSHKAPVASVTKAQCQKTLDENIQDMKVSDSDYNLTIANLLYSLSIYDVPYEQWVSFVKNATVSTYISANENNELSVSCFGV